MRLQMKCEGATVGIYVGKYGGLYYDQEAFYLYKRCLETIPGFRLIILSPHPQEEILQHLGQSGIDKAKVYITSVPHAEVPVYLSAADFAFATYKPGPSKRFLSPIKTGEYWANGLPVLLTEGVGDDSDIIKCEGGGATFNLREEGSVERALEKIQQILKDPAHRQEIPRLAQKYRSPERIREAYEYFFGQSKEEQP
ncbi:glycosyltransferase family protein [Pontibacter russatus]|uniref:glycosyltransferase family 4 protein n=1 Tax=Pontibacter russatus TaxID=2694929 RepID=UPI001379FC99|nr:glycosyltransferase family 4 protein [Pontibacter russatus]